MTKPLALVLALFLGLVAFGITYLGGYVHTCLHVVTPLYWVFVKLGAATAGILTAFAVYLETK